MFQLVFLYVYVVFVYVYTSNLSTACKVQSNSHYIEYGNLMTNVATAHTYYKLILLVCIMITFPSRLLHIVLQFIYTASCLLLQDTTQQWSLLHKKQYCQLQLLSNIESIVVKCLETTQNPPTGTDFRRLRYIQFKSVIFVYYYQQDFLINCCIMLQQKNQRKKQFAEKYAKRQAQWD